MVERLLIVLALLLATTRAHAQEIPFPQAAITDDTELARAVPSIARRILTADRSESSDRSLHETFVLQLAAGEYVDAVGTLQRLRAQASPPAAAPTRVELYAQARALQHTERLTLEDAWRKVLQQAFAKLNDRQAYDLAWMLGTAPQVLRRSMEPLRQRQTGRSMISQAQAVDLIRTWLAYDSSRDSRSAIDAVVAEDEARRYMIQDDVLIPTKHGATLSAMIVRSRNAAKQPTALLTVIQTNPAWTLTRAKFAASRGYVGMSSDTRGKRLSPDGIVLFEHDAEDLYGVIDWISRQPWSDGQVGMYGGSNAGYTAWAAAKSLHPALKTIVPYCPLNPGFGLPMMNNVFITANYDVHFLLGNAKYGDERFASRGRADAMIAEWYRSGRPYREIDQVDGNPNEFLQRFLRHPAYDEFWQSLTAEGKDYQKLDIPILAIDGYYDDGQNDAVRRLREHYKYRPDAEHYLVIGPYDHFGTQAARKAPVVRGYPIDPVAHFDTQDLTFRWFDYVLKDEPKPEMLRDKINYQVMGANVWRHAPSIEAMSSEKLTLFFTNSRADRYHELSSQAPATRAGVKQVVNFTDRSTTSVSYYPGAIVSPSLDLQDAVAFVSEPLERPTSINGLFSARLRAITNKKDMDIAMVLYEITPSGEFFHLSHTLQRASYARDMTRRHLLVPHEPQTIPLDNTLLVSRRLSEGSRLLVVLDINRGPWAQINYGTGKDVSDESIADAKEPLVVEWLNDSTIVVPISREVRKVP